MCLRKAIALMAMLMLLLAAIPLSEARAAGAHGHGLTAEIARLPQPKGASAIIGDWVVSGDEQRSNEVIVLTGNLRVLSGGRLKLINITLLLNCSYDGEFSITVEPGGSLCIVNSYIGPYRPAFAFAFLVKPGAYFRAAYSTISRCGCEPAGGLTIYANHSYVEGCLISSSPTGLEVIGAWNVSIVSCCFTNCSYSDITCSNAHNLTLVGNCFSGIVEVVNSTNVVVVDNVFSGGGRAGLLFNHLVSIAEFENNTLAGKPILLVNSTGSQAISGEYGQVIVLNSTSISIEGLVLNNTVAAIQVFYSSVLLNSCIMALNHISILCGFSNLTVIGCAISSSDIGIACYGNQTKWAFLNVNSSAIEGNYYGITTWWAILSAYRNRIAYNTIGISISCQEQAPLGQLQAILSPLTSHLPCQAPGQHEIHYNNIYGNVGLGLRVGDGCSLANATYNWWNSTTGPEPSLSWWGGDSEDPEEIYGDVLYEPWLPAPILPPDDGEPPLLFKAIMVGGPLVCGRVLVIVVAADPIGIKGAYLLVDGQLAYEDHRPPYVFTWNTSAWPDGEHALAIEVADLAGNRAWAYLSAIVDNTPPEVQIAAPADGAIIRGFCSVIARASDEHLSTIKLLLDGLTLAEWDEAGEHALELDTRELFDGQHELELVAYDELGHSSSTSISFTVDNTPPTIRAISISPEQPTPSEDVVVSVIVEDAVSGVAEVILSFNDGSGWANTTMASAGGGRYEAKISARLAGTVVHLKIYARDLAGNWASSAEHSYKVVSQLMPAIFTMLAITGMVIIVGMAVGLSRRLRA